MLTEALNVTIFVSSFLNFVRALNERSYWLIEMNIRKVSDLDQNKKSKFHYCYIDLAIRPSFAKHFKEYQENTSASTLQW